MPESFQNTILRPNGSDHTSAILMKHFGYFLLSTMIVLSGWGYQSLLFCHHSNFCLMENMRISQRLIALSNVCLFKWDQNINHARQVIKAWWSQIYVGNVQFFLLNFHLNFQQLIQWQWRWKRIYESSITYSPALKPPIVPRSHFYCWLKFFMDANCLD